MYRLDYADTGEAVREPLLDRDYLARHMQTARAKAVATARHHSRPILISRISNAGNLRPSLVIEPSGRAHRPPSTKAVSREDCRRETGPCFCSPCRAERREARV